MFTHIDFMDVYINVHNLQPHIDIERDIQTKENGLVTFNLRINEGMIEDYASFQTITANDYRGVVFTNRQEHPLT